MFVGFVRVPVIEARLLPDAPPVIPPVRVGFPHEYVVPVGMVFPEVGGVKVKALPLQEDISMVVFICGFGFIVII